jgi:hypothetical protein
MSGARRPRSPTASPALFAHVRMSAVEDVVMQHSLTTAAPCPASALYQRHSWRTRNLKGRPAL